MAHAGPCGIVSNGRRMEHLLERILCLVNPIFGKEVPLIQLFVCTVADVAVHFLQYNQ